MKKPNIWLVIILIFAILTVLSVITIQLGWISISIILLERIALLIYSYNITNWNKIKGTNIVNASLLLILFSSLIFVKHINNFEFYNNRIPFQLVTLLTEILFILACFLSFLNFLHEQNKQNKYFMIAVVLSIIADIIYGLQNLNAMVSAIILMISSILYTVSLYITILSDKIRENN